MSTLLHHHTPLRAAILALTVLTAQAVGTVAAVTVTEADTTAAADPRLAPDFVTASLLLASPGEKVYQIFGHAAIRMQCPAHGLDNVFTYEVDILGDGFASYFFNRASARLAAVPAADYIDTYRREGRSVMMLRLNLTPVEKQELWRWLDMMAFEAPENTFNQRRRNCLSVAMERIGKAVSPARIVPPALSLAKTNGEILYDAGEGASEWHRIGYRLVPGADADVCDRMLMLPSHTITDHAGWTIVGSDGSVRPLFVGRPVMLTAPAMPLRHSPVTPLAVAIAAGVLSVALSVASRFRRFVGAGRVFAVTVMAVLAAGWVALVFIAAVPNTVTAPWNWFMVVFNPLPLIGWATLRRKPFFPLAATVYGAVQIAFGAFSPLFTSQANAPLSVLAIALGAAAIIATSNTDKTNHK